MGDMLCLSESHPASAAKDADANVALLFVVEAGWLCI
jgi:hypothetical protein